MVKKTIVCIDEKRYISIFYICLWSAGDSLISDMQNLEISGFQLRMRINTKLNGQHILKLHRDTETFFKRLQQKTVFVVIALKCFPVFPR